MVLKYLLPVIILLSGCEQNGNFLNKFRDGGELKVECIREVKGNSIVKMNSMHKIGEYIIWNNKDNKPTILYAYHLQMDSLIEFTIPLKDSTFSYYPEKLYAYNDTVILSFNDTYQYFSYIHLKDSFYVSGYLSLNIMNEEFFDWKGKVSLSYVYPGQDSLFLVGHISTKIVDYGVYDCYSQYLYPSNSCIPPTALEMKCLYPDDKNYISIIKQKGKSRYAVFRSLYQLYDVIDRRGTALYLLERSVTHHSLLTWQDQYNLQQNLKYSFFPGFFIQSSQYIMTLYQSPENRQYLLVLDWEGNPLYAYHFPDELYVYGLCGEDSPVFYVAGKMRNGKTGLFKIEY